ncbi:MAG: metallophosphoesterase family protein [Clostridia bacterium]
MRIALIADLHGNRPATEALARDLALQKADRIICLGDVVGKGPSSDYTFDWAFANCELILGGNWDFGVGNQSFEPDLFYWEQLGAKRLKKLRELPLEAELAFSGRRIRLLHGRPLMPDLITVADPQSDIAPYFVDQQGVAYNAVIYADAHRQALRTVCNGLFVNTGSVGNAMGVPKCCYALLEGTESAGAGAGAGAGADNAFELRFRQLDYDTQQAVQDALAAPRVPRIESYIREVQTGIYSR